MDRENQNKPSVKDRHLAISQKPSVTELGRLMALTQERFLHSPVTEIQATLWLEDWERLATEFGMRQFRSGLESLWTKARFFPLPGEIRAECESLEIPEPRISEYKHFDPPADPISEQEFSAMLDEYPQLDKWREQKRA